MGAGSGRCVRWRGAREDLDPEVRGSRDADCFARCPLNLRWDRGADASGSQKAPQPRAEKARDADPFLVGAITAIPVLSRRGSMVSLSMRNGSTETLRPQIPIGEREADVNRRNDVREEEEVNDEGGKKGRPGDKCAKAQHHVPNSRWRCPPHGKRPPHAMQLPSSATATRKPLKHP